MASKCPAFQKGCHLKGCQTVGEFEDKLGQMRDQCKGNAAYVQFLRETVLTAKEKEATVGSACPFFQTKARCPFAKDTIESRYFLRTTSWYVLFYEPVSFYFGFIAYISNVFFVVICSKGYHRYHFERCDV